MFKDLKYKLNEFWSEFRKVKSGVVGLVFLIIFVLMIIFEPLISPFPEAGKRWRDITYWEDNSKSAPPVWINLFTGKKYARSETLTEPIENITDNGRVKITEYEFDYDYKADRPPGDIIFRTEATGNLLFITEIIRPDGETVSLTRNNYNFSNKSNVRIALSNDSKNGAYELATKFDKENTLSIPKQSIDGFNILFSKAQENMVNTHEALKGTYKIRIRILNPGSNGVLENPRVIISGSVSGILGTDNSKRDIWSGIVAGVKWAMLIGLLTSALSVAIGVIYGVISAYLGGFADSLLQRIYEIFVSMPVLPVLIVLGAVFKPSIWIMIIIMCVFFWTGPVKTVRSIGLQIKEETYIEASKAIGATNTRIIFKHMIPLLIPYSFASMALSVPSAIVYEATISMLGLGDPSITSWGQILQDANSAGAVIQGLWWWVVPPGLMISLVGMTFAFIGFAMDKILLPKLKTR